jgi:hypothetical protein
MRRPLAYVAPAVLLLALLCGCSTSFTWPPRNVAAAHAIVASRYDAASLVRLGSEMDEKEALALAYGAKTPTCQAATDGGSLIEIRWLDPLNAMVLLDCVVRGKTGYDERGRAHGCTRTYRYLHIVEKKREQWHHVTYYERGVASICA